MTGILAHKWESLMYLMQIVKIAYTNMPGRIRPELSENKATKLSIKGTNSTIFSSLQIQSTALHNLHLSEWGLCDNVRVWETLAAASRHTNITGESVGAGMGNDHFQTYDDAKNGRNDYDYLFVPWFADDGYRLPLDGMPPPVPTPHEAKLHLDPNQILWRRSTVASVKEQFRSLYPETEEDAFAQAGLNAFDLRKMIVLAREAREFNKLNPPAESDDQITMWERPMAGEAYVAGGDVAEGITMNGTRDYSVLKIINVSTMREVFRYRARVGVDVFYKACDFYCRMFNNALLAIERNNHGHAVLLGLYEIKKYPNLYFEKQENRLLEPNHGPATSNPITKDVVRLGWHTTSITKPIMVDQLKLAIEQDTAIDEDNFDPLFLIRDEIFLSECLTYQQEGVKFGAAVGKHDDDVMATAIANQMVLLRRRHGEVWANVLTGGARETVI